MRGTAPQLLQLRCHALPSTVMALAGVAIAAGGYARWTTASRAQTPQLAPLSPSLLRPWWPLRSAHLLALTALAAALLSLAVPPGHPMEFGAAAMVRNVLGAVGVTALFVPVLGARLSWLPMFAYGSAALLTSESPPGGANALWNWLMQPGPELPAWLVAGAAFAAGTTAYAVRGPRPSYEPG